jgi:putative peptidoglycan lipid II flippase
MRRSSRFASPRTLLGLAGVYASSRLLGLLREIGIAFFFGTSVAADRLSAAFVVASLVTIVGGEALYTGAVRWLVRASPAHLTAVSETRYAELISMGARAALVGTAAFAVLGPIATLIVLGHTTGAAQTIALSVALAPSIGASLFSACVNARLTLERRFVLLNVVQILYSFGALIGLALIGLAGQHIGPLPVAAGWSAGNVAAALVLYARARPSPIARGSLMPRGSLSASAFELLRIGLPIATAYSLVAVQGLTDRTVAARLGPGRVAALSYADRLFLLPIGFVIAALGPMVLGSLVTERRSAERGGSLAFEQLRTLVASLVPLSLLFVAIAPQLVSVIFESGDFGARSRHLTVAALDGFSVGIAAVALSLVLFRMMQAVSRLREVVLVSGIAAALNAVLSVAGGVWLGLYGVTLATSIVALAVVQIQTGRLIGELGRDWAVEVLKGAIGPVAACCALSIIVVTADHQNALSESGRMAILTGAAIGTALISVLRRRRVE